jgi:hypothetical protein
MATVNRPVYGILLEHSFATNRQRHDSGRHIGTVVSEFAAIDVAI